MKEEKAVAVPPPSSVDTDQAVFVKNKDVEAAWTDIDDGFDPVLIKRTVRKADWRLIPMLSAMYCISLLDRNNLAIARSANGNVMNRQLQLDKGNHYSVVALVFFITYIILEIPSQVGLRKFGARWWLGTATSLWGIVMLGMGFVTTWQQLAGLRTILGAFESALYPGASFLIACWYPRRNMATRNVIFYITSKIISGLGNIMSWGISQLHMRRGIEGWRWIFILQGSLTVVIGLCGYVFITDFPDKAKFLTDEERHLILTRIERDRSDSEPDKLTRAKMCKYACDIKIWLFSFFFCTTTVGLSSMSYFLPQILASMGFNNAQSQLLTAPPFIFTVFPAVAGAYVSDKLGWRSGTIIVNSLLFMTGTLMYSQLPVDRKAARYAGTFLSVGYSAANTPLIMSWAQTSIRSQSKRGFASAMIVAWGGIGGILASVTFMQKEASKGYPTGIWFVVAMQVTSVIGCTSLSLWFRRQNRRADNGEINELEGSSNFRYGL